jgi:hypothetical protein
VLPYSLLRFAVLIHVGDNTRGDRVSGESALGSRRHGWNTCLGRVQSYGTRRYVASISAVAVDDDPLRAATINVKFTLSNAPSQSEQLRKLLARAPRLRSLALRRPLPETFKESRWEPTRSKTATHPFPLRSSHLQSSYLAELTHLELSGLSIHPMIFTRLPSSHISNSRSPPTTTRTFRPRCSTSSHSPGGVNSLHLRLGCTR